MTQRVVIVGAGHAGVQLSASLRDAGFDGDITMVGDEAVLPYQRPPLSKAYLLGKQDVGGLYLKSPEVYKELRVDYIAGDRVRSVERSDGVAVLQSGKRLRYDRIVLATGGRRIGLPVPGAHLDGVVGLRSFADASDIKERLADVKSAVVVGGGFIGLEFASVARSLGVEVSLVELAPRVLGRSASDIMAQHVESVHREHGVRFRFGERVARLNGARGLEEVELQSDDTIAADLVLVGIGMVPNVELAVSAELPVLDGILVDEYLQTSDPNILAIGDCARFPIEGEMVRLESVPNATDQAKHAAETIMGRLTPFKATPWFWSDQGNMKIQIAGLGAGADRHIVRGKTEAGSFSVFCFRGDRLIAVESINRSSDHIMARRLLAAGATLTDTQASDETFALKNALPRNANREQPTGVVR